ncbi:MAG: YbfB/YjiJ family MFS transporter [Rubrivivax sp.]
MQPIARQTILTALALALGAAVSLGLARFSYALLLPPMREELGWSYFTAGALNTLNAAGYLLGALAMPGWLRRRGALAAQQALVGGSLLAAALLALHAFTREDALLALWRLATGVASAAVFVSGGLLAARLSAQPGVESRVSSGLVLGLYYGGTGLGIVACAALLPPLVDGLAAGSGLAGWQAGWLGLALLAALAAWPMAHRLARWPLPPAPPPSRAGRLDARPLAAALAGYCCFGLGYIGYMTFIVTLLREQGMAAGVIAAFYALLGLGVMASPWLWAGLLQRARGGGALALLNALLALATVLPVLVSHPLAAFASGALFGAVFLSVVASTTAIVRHNLPQGDWSAGISAFTIVFAAGQIVGPSLVGGLADGAGGLRAGLAVSAALLALGAAVATLQRPLAGPAQSRP